MLDTFATYITKLCKQALLHFRQTHLTRATMVISTQFSIVRKYLRRLTDIWNISLPARRTRSTVSRGQRLIRRRGPGTWLVWRPGGEAVALWVRGRGCMSW